MRHHFARPALGLFLSFSLALTPLAALAAPTPTDITLSHPPLEGHVSKQSIESPVETPFESNLTTRQVVLPENTSFTASLTSPLLSRESVQGDKFELILDKDIKTADTQVAIPKGSLLHAEVIMLKGSKLAHIKAQMGIKFYEIVTPDGQIIPIEGQIDSKTGYLKGNRRRMDTGSVALMVARQAVKTGIQLAAGAAAGYGAGIALFIVVKRGKDVIYKPGEKLPVKLVKPAEFAVTTVSVPVSNPTAPVTTGSA